jgi:hypothetical protein
MEYTLELAERLVEKLRAMPPKAPSKRRLDKQGLVKHLAEEIASLQQRGYTIEEVAESLRGHGLDITTPTLKNYLQRARGKRVKPRKPQRPSERPRAGARAGQATPASAVPPVLGKAAPDSSPTPPAAVPPVPGEAAPDSSPTPLAAPPKAETPPSPRRDPEFRSGKGAFPAADKESY